MTTITKETKNYIEAVGKRKESIARVRITPSIKNTFNVNGKTLEEYFSTEELRVLVHEPIEKSNTDKKFSISVLATLSGSKRL